MTRDEILAQAKVGGFATFRARIDEVDGHVSYPICVWQDRWPNFEDIIAIEPPPETDAEKIARLEARVRELEAQAKRIGTGPFPK